MKSSRLYLTTSIAYANAAPHLGHALEAIQADCLIRFYRRQYGQANVFFLTGTDEHGQKQFETAKKAGLTPKQLADQSSDSFKELYKRLNISYNRFIRTTDADHMVAAQTIWRACQKDIYKKQYEGLYCVGCESFKTEKELIDGLCPNHKIKPEKLTEENYFFRLSGYSHQIRKLIEDDRLRIIPATRRKEFLTVLKQDGLSDVSISRQKDRLPWGIPVPGDPDQVMYVWFDALTNYLTGSGYAGTSPERRTEHAKWWLSPDSRVVHLIGKDIIRHHAGIWPGMLLSAGIRLPDTILVHGFVTNEGQKMSKSLGNVVSPQWLVDAYGSEPIRFYLLQALPSDEDGDFSLTDFQERYRAYLANGVGNLFSRVTNMVEKFLDGQIDEKIISGKKSRIATSLTEDMEQFRFHIALQKIWKHIDKANQLIDQKKPWEMAKRQKKNELSALLHDLVSQLLLISQALEPFIPQTAASIRSHVQTTPMKKAAPLFPIRRNNQL